MAQEGPSCCQKILALETAHAAKQLFQDHELALRISVSLAARLTNVVSTAISYLGSNLHHFDTYSIPTEQPAASTSLQLIKTPPMTYQQVQALSDSAASVCTLWVADSGDFVASTHVTEALATMANLTKLHLTVSRGRYGDPTDFQPLAQLSMLQDLALQCNDGYNTCEGVVMRNRHTLRKVILMAYAWSASTYSSLQAVAQLDFLSISIRGLDTEQAHAFGSITAEVFRLNLHGTIRENALAALNSSSPAVCELTVWDLDQAFSLPQLPSLQRLTIVSCGGFSGKGLENFASVTQLTLVDQIAISGEGLQYVIRKALPALEAIALYMTLNYGRDCRLSELALNALLSGPHLKLIDLRGITDLTDNRVTQLKGAVQNKQARGVMQPCVTLVLSPFFDFEPVRRTTVQRMFVPNLFVWPAGTHVAHKTVIT